ncbi:MAG: DUF1592 domain-containing protein [Pirellulaceae bacterium]
MQVRRLGYRLAGMAMLVWVGTAAVSLAEQPERDHFVGLAEEYTAQAQPLLKQYCLDCHSTAEQQGELDLERFSSLAEVRQGTKVWQSVIEMLDNGEMPPKDAEAGLAPQKRKQLRDWISRYLDAEALANAGDPGPVVLRRLGNAQYAYTIHDLTGVNLDPAREFPVDGAAGEGFTNTGNALVMSPALLTKYLDAGKRIAKHVVPLPTGFRFSESPTQSDWTNESLAEIRGFYDRFTGAGGGAHVNLQGVQFETNSGGRLPLRPYLAATLAERDALRTGEKAIDQVAEARGLSGKYLGILWDSLNEPQSSRLLGVIRTRWQESKVEDVESLAAGIEEWQGSLFKFSSVGHIGKVGGPTAWQEPVTPLSARHNFQVKMPSLTDQGEVVLYLVVSDAGDGPEQDFAVWERPRIVIPGRPDLLLRDVQEITARMTARRELLFRSTSKALEAAAEAGGSTDAIDIEALAQQHAVESPILSAWLDYLGIGPGSTIQLDHFTQKLTRAGNYDFVQGWGAPETPNLYANASDQHVRIPGNMKPKGVTIHPSPTHAAAVGWQSPIHGTLRIEGQVTHAHPECGNGVTWTLERRRGGNRQRLAHGVSHGGNPVQVGPVESLAVRPGDLVSLLIGPREGSHACDLTDLELIFTSDGDESQTWSLTEDVASDILAGNPHADRLGNEAVWHFYTEPIEGRETGPVIPAGSLLAQWQAAEETGEKQRLAEAIQKLLTSGPAADAPPEDPNFRLYRQLTSFRGPFSYADSEALPLSERQETSTAGPSYGLDPKRFGKRPDGSEIEAGSLCVQAPAVVEIRLPADLVADAEFVTTGKLDPSTGKNGSVQFQILKTKPAQEFGLLPTAISENQEDGSWTSNNRRISAATPVVVQTDSTQRQQWEQAFEDFRQLFPVALCYTEIVPVDEVVTLTLFHREDEALRRLMLNDEQAQQLDRMWEELHFVSHDALTLVDAFEQLLEYASQDGDPKVFEPLREPIQRRAAEFEQALIRAEPKHLEALIDFAAQAYRRPLKEHEAQALRGLYTDLREQELSHDEAFRFTLARIFVSPGFLYRLERAPEGSAAGPISDWELANRLSYFLWSSQPDEPLRAAARAGTLHQPEALEQQARRMIQSPRIRRLATEFACQWLHIYEFDTLDEKSNETFPEFVDLRADMHEEAIRFFTDLFQSDASILDIFEANHTFLNERLAKFYGIQWKPEPDQDPDSWQRVEGMRGHGRGGALGLAATLAKHSGASRSSPILRGVWISETILGEKLPKPPAGVPPLPEDPAVAEGLTMRQLTELHTTEPSCASCHARIDPFGFALEQYDAIGRLRDRDRSGRPLDTASVLYDGNQIEGFEGLRNYLLETRREAVIRQFCRKLLGYSLGRAVQLSDEPLLTEMRENLARHEYRFSAAVETIIQSQQFREIRGRDAVVADLP